jgi:hypothetical protein
LKIADGKLEFLLLIDLLIPPRGGQSKCPGESGTSKRESGTTIKMIRHRCGPNHDQICDESTLGPEDKAYLGVVLENLSPTSKWILYLFLASSQEII